MRDERDRTETAGAGAGTAEGSTTGIAPGKRNLVEALQASLHPGMIASNTATFAPGKRSLVEVLQASLRPGRGRDHAAGPVGAHFGSTAPPVAAGTAHRAPPPRVADSAAEPNAVLRVVVSDAAGAVIQRWESRGRWEGGLPQTYTATRAGKGWAWDNTGGSTIRVNTDQDGRGGAPLEAWAKAAAQTIVVYAYASEDVTIDDGAAASDQAPGHARDPQQGRGGATPERVAPAGKGAGGDLRTGRDSGARGAGKQEGQQGSQHDGAGHQEGQQGSDGIDTETEAATEVELGTEVDDRIADAFERDLGIDPDEELEDDATSEATSDDLLPGSKSPPGRDVDGRTGEDTRIGGTGPGGDRARPDGQGKGADAGGKDGSEGGSKDGGGYVRCPRRVKARWFERIPGSGLLYEETTSGGVFCGRAMRRRAASRSPTSTRLLDGHGAWARAPARQKRRSATWAP